MAEGPPKDSTPPELLDALDASSDAFYHRLMDLLPDAITISDLEGRIVKTNNRGAQLYGAEGADEMVGRNAFELIAPEDRERAASNLQKTLETGRLDHVQYTMVRKDGSRYPGELSASLIPGPGGKPLAFVATVRDVSARKRIEAQLAQADRLANLGVLAAGVAHEVNNPLAYLLLNMSKVAEDLPRLAEGAEHCRAMIRDLCDKLGDEAPDNGDQAPCSRGRLTELANLARLAAEGGERVKKIVNDLRTFSRTDDDQRVLVQPNEVLDNAINLASAEIGDEVRLSKDYSDLPRIMASERRLCQVFLNLLLNAAHAVAEIEDGPGQIVVRTRGDATEVTVDVTDNGTGIAPEVARRMFEPFFTTKPDGVGTGMGLSICQNIVHAHGGSIDVESSPSGGSRFRVRLPIQTA
jgi:PAS domain S-box-containing protein